VSLAAASDGLRGRAGRDQAARYPIQPGHHGRALFWREANTVEALTLDIDADASELAIDDDGSLLTSRLRQRLVTAPCLESEPERS